MIPRSCDARLEIMARHDPHAIRHPECCCLRGVHRPILAAGAVPVTSLRVPERIAPGTRGHEKSNRIALGLCSPPRAEQDIDRTTLPNPPHRGGARPLPYRLQLTTKKRLLVVPPNELVATNPVSLPPPITSYPLVPQRFPACSKQLAMLSPHPYR